MRVVFLNRYFYPDHAPTSVLLSDLAFALSKRGVSVTVITSRLRYDGSSRQLASRERIQDVDVHRVWTSRYGRAGLFGRSLDYASFYFAAAFRLWWAAGRWDIIIAKTDPPLLSLMAAGIARLRGARLVNWLQDIFPEVAMALRLGGSVGRLGFGLIRPLRNWSLNSATTNVVVGASMAKHLEKEKIPTEKIRLIRNWADGTLISPIGAAENQIRNSWQLKDRFVVGYAGNFGRAHDLGTIVSAMTLLHEQALKAAEDDIVRRISFAFVGGGAQFPILEREIVQRHLANVQIHPYQPQERLSETLGVADVHLVSLNPEVEGFIVPSKFYGIAAAGRPVLFIGAAEGEIARLIDQAVCGFNVATGDGQALKDRILQLAKDPELRAAMGARARSAFEQHWEKSRAIGEWAELLRLVSVKKTSSTVRRWPTTTDKLCDKRSAQ